MNDNRLFGKRCGFRVPPVNIGAMRLPRDHDEAVALIRHAIDRGMKYIDTSRGYGESDIKVGKALKDGYRQKVILSTKCSPWIMKVEETDDASADCTRRRIEESMNRLDVDHLDFYQVWNIDSRAHYDLAVAKGGMVEGIRKAMDEGLVGHTGFTTHDSVENILAYVKEADWCEIILFSYNLLNDTYGPAIEAAHRNGIGTVIMNPMGGGVLGHSSALLDELSEQVGVSSPADLGMRYILSNPNIDAVIAGISKISDVESGIASAEAPRLSGKQMALIKSRLGPIVAERQAFCTWCRYCMPCPQGIEIPVVMDLIAQQRLFGFDDYACEHYNAMKTPGAGACEKCGKCEAKCTQHLAIMKEMAYAAEKFGAGPPGKKSGQES